MDFDVLGRWPGVLGRLTAGESLSTTEAECVMGEVLSGTATAAQLGALLGALRAKGETVEEMSGFSRAMLVHAEPIHVEGDPVDVVGTGGDRLASINVSTLAACIAAGAGARVCKHGNRAASSSVGTADVLEALGVAVDLGPAGVVRCVEEAGMGFCYAPRYHPAMRHAGPVRRELGIPTVFNFLGPLANPARAVRQLVGVSDRAMAQTMAAVLGANGSRHAMVVYADDGLDELSVVSTSTVLEVIRRDDSADAAAGPVGSGHFGSAGSRGSAGSQGSAASTEPYEVRTWRVDPGALGFAAARMEDLAGGDAEFNAAVISGVLGGERGPCRDIGVLNAAAALVVAGAAADLAEGVGRAEEALDTGRAARVLERLVQVSRAALDAERDEAGSRASAGEA